MTTYERRKQQGLCPLCGITDMRGTGKVVCERCMERVNKSRHANKDKINKRRKEIRDYRRQHNRCPNCGAKLDSEDIANPKITFCKKCRSMYKATPSYKRKCKVYKYKGKIKKVKKRICTNDILKLIKKNLNKDSLSKTDRLDFIEKMEIELDLIGLGER